MNKRARNFLLIFCPLVAWIIAYYQFRSHKQRHERLINNGQVVKAISNYNEQFWVGYAHFSFITNQGIKIEENRKCGDKESFDRKYATLAIIYNQDNPYEYESMGDFANYDLTWLNIFFYGIYPAGVTLVFYGTLRIIYLVGAKLKRTRSL